MGLWAADHASGRQEQKCAADVDALVRQRLLPTLVGIVKVVPWPHAAVGRDPCTWM